MKKKVQPIESCIQFDFKLEQHKAEVIYIPFTSEEKERHPKFRYRALVIVNGNTLQTWLSYNFNRTSTKRLLLETLKGFEPKYLLETFNLVA